MEDWVERRSGWCKRGTNSAGEHGFQRTQSNFFCSDEISLTEPATRAGVQSRQESRFPLGVVSMSFPRTLGELRQSPFSEQRLFARRVKDELRDNLVCKLREGGPLFPGIVGYEDTVVPQIVNAILSRHNFILLGLRGQAKSRILRALTTLLDPQMA